MALMQLARSGGFQSTLPVWGATIPGVIYMMDDAISIHAPRVGSDQILSPPTCRPW